MYINDLIKLASLLDNNGEYRLASKVDELILKVAEEEGIVVSPETLKEMKDNIKLMNNDLEETIEFLKGNNIVEEEPSINKSVAGIEHIFEKLSYIADDLDSSGAIKEADLIDNFIKKHAGPVLEDVVDWKEEGDTEQSRRYDSKHHHNLQVREPKRDQEKVDREGHKDHHVKTYDPTSSTLSTRYCPDHIGAQMGRVAESTYQCPIDGKVYNWETGYTDYNGEQHPGGSVAAQTPDSSGVAVPHRIFDSRDETLNRLH